jgi:hypothetical protein
VSAALAFEVELALVLGATLVAVAGDDGGGITTAGECNVENNEGRWGEAVCG